MATKPPPMTSKTLLALIVTIVLWAAAFVGIRAAIVDYSPGSLALFRYLVASVCMFILYIRLPQRTKIRKQDWPLLLMTGVIGFGVYNIALNYGEITVTAGIASFIVGQMPVFTVVMAVMFLSERLTGKGWLGIAISFIGMFLIAVGEREGAHFDIGVLFTLIATFTGSLYTVLQKPLLKRLHPVEIVAFSMWFGTAVMLIYTPQLIHEFPKASLHSTLMVVFLGIFPAAVAFSTWSYALQRITVSRAASFLYGMPIVATLLGWLYLGEFPHTLALTGGLVALLGAWLMNQ